MTQTRVLTHGLASALLGLALFSGAAVAQESPQAIYLDDGGVVRWRGSDEEVRLFGANYCAFSGGDYRAAGRVSDDRKAMIREDMAQFARMGWDGLRLCTWGDWENADTQGNRIENDHTDLMDYLIAQARARGLYMLLTPIHTYNPGWPDALDRSDELPGFSRIYGRSVLGTDPNAIAAEVNFITQTLNHVNPYTGDALKDDPNILFVEMINEPHHHSEDVPGSVAYINALNEAVRVTGSQQITFHNYTQDMAIGAAIGQSDVQGASFGWYPSGLVAGRTLQGNFLQAVDGYPGMLDPVIAGRPRIVYEFDQADLVTGYMYPAMARTYRSVGAQFASIFAYDMLQSAPFNLGWQTHYINLVHTPRKAMSAVIAAEVMRRLPRMQDYGAYPETTRFGDFRVSYEDDLSELNAADAFMHAGDTATRARAPARLQRIAGVGSSPVVDYEGTGAYFLDKVREGVWRLEVYPDSVYVAEPFAQPQPGRVVSRLYSRAWPIDVTLPDLGARFTATPLNVPSHAGTQRASAGAFAVEPGVWLLTRNARVDRASLPEAINRVGMDEFHINAPQTYPDWIGTETAPEFIEGADALIRVRVASQMLPETVRLYVRPASAGGFPRQVEMRRTRGYEYETRIAAADLPAGMYEYAVTIESAGASTTFPGAAAGRPGAWPFALDETWSFMVAPASAPLRIFDPGRDFRELSFVRPSENFRAPAYRLDIGEASSEPVVVLSVPNVPPEMGEEGPAHYAAALYVGERVAARGAGGARADTLAVRLRAADGARKTLELFLIEKDGSSWRGEFVAGADWADARVRLEDLEFSRSIHIPSPFPGLWNYWREGPAARAGGRIRAEDIERLELRVRRNSGDTASDDAVGVEIGSVWLEYGSP